MDFFTTGAGAGAGAALATGAATGAATGTEAARCVERAAGVTAVGGAWTAAGSGFNGGMAICPDDAMLSKNMSSSRPPNILSKMSSWPPMPGESARALAAVDDALTVSRGGSGRAAADAVGRATGATGAAIGASSFARLAVMSPEATVAPALHVMKRGG